MHVCVCVCVYGISKSKDKLGGYPYIRMRVRLRMIFKYTEKKKTRIWIPSLRLIVPLLSFGTPWPNK